MSKMTSLFFLIALFFGGNPAHSMEEGLTTVNVEYSGCGDHGNPVVIVSFSGDEIAGLEMETSLHTGYHTINFRVAVAPSSDFPFGTTFMTELTSPIEWR